MTCPDLLGHPARWHTVNVAYRPVPGRSAAAVRVYTGIDLPDLLALTTSDPPLLQFVNLWGPPHPATTAVTGPDHLVHVAVHTTSAGDRWVTATPDNVLVRYLAGQGGHGHLSTIAGRLDITADVLARLTGRTMAVVRHINQPGRPYTVDEITPGLIDEPRGITVTLTDLGHRVAAART